MVTTRHFGKNAYFRVSMSLLIVASIACDSIRPSSETETILDISRNVSAGLFIPGGSAPNRPVFIRHFEYVTRGSAWGMYSTGQPGSGTQFEEASVFALIRKGSAGVVQVTRLARLPSGILSGNSESRVHLAISAPGPLGTGNSTAIVYFEDGPIFGGLDVGVPISGSEPIDMPVHLLVDARVSCAALAADGSTVAFVDNKGRLFVKSAMSQPEMVFDIRQRLGPVDVLRIKWEGFPVGRVVVVLDRGFVREVRQLETRFDTRLAPTFRDPDTLLDTDESLLAEIDNLTSDLGASSWRVPELSRFGAAE